ncbi:hypothetical protein ACTG9Q_32600 [Actinokineospora sp. 24-640]
MGDMVPSHPEDAHGNDLAVAIDQIADGQRWAVRGPSSSTATFFPGQPLHGAVPS